MGLAPQAAARAPQHQQPIAQRHLGHLPHELRLAVSVVRSSPLCKNVRPRSSLSEQVATGRKSMTDITTFRTLLLPVGWQTAGLLSEGCATATAAVAVACSEAATASWLLFLAALSARGVPTLLLSPLGVPNMPEIEQEVRQGKHPFSPETGRQCDVDTLKTNAGTPCVSHLRKRLLKHCVLVA